MERTKSQFRLPTLEDINNLYPRFTKWNEEKKGMEIWDGRHDFLFLPADGYIDDISSNNADNYVGSRGCYWSSNVLKCGDCSDTLYFYSKNWCVRSNYHHHSYKLSVRLVSDEPFEGGVEFDGVWWKPENEPGYYSWTEAMDKFNK